MAIDRPVEKQPTTPQHMRENSQPLLPFSFNNRKSTNLFMQQPAFDVSNHEASMPYAFQSPSIRQRAEGGSAIGRNIIDAQIAPGDSASQIMVDDMSGNGLS